MYLVRISIVFSLFVITVASKTDSFNRSHLAVWFDPYVATADKDVWGAYDVNGLIPMIAKISSKFNTVMMSKYYARSAKRVNSIALIPSAVATYNKVHQSPTNFPIEVLMTVLLNVYAPDRTKFILAKQLADEANEIHKGTVKILYIYLSGYSEQTLPTAEKFLSYALNELKNNPGYELGAQMSLIFCGNANEKLASHITPLFPYLKRIMFYMTAKESDVINGAEAMAQRFIRAFGECQQNVKLYEPNLPVEFYTGWEYTNKTDLEENNRNLVTFWEKMDGWASMTNTKVVLYEAFDNPRRPAPGARQMGWWKLVENASYVNSSQYVFEEKGVSTVQKPSEPKNGYEPALTSSLTSIWAVGVSLLLILSLVGLVVLYKRLRLYKYRLNSEDLRVFHQGSPAEDLDGAENSLCSVITAAYNKDLELLKTWFKIDRNSKLGEGAFGTVYRGTIQKEGSELETEVAVKTTKARCPHLAVMGLMSEIKVLSHLGEHENIVGLLGAYTKELKKGKIYVFLELCSLGSLDKYLRAILASVKKETGGTSPNNLQLTTEEHLEVRMENLTPSSADEDILEFEGIPINEPVTSAVNSQSESGPNSADLLRWSCDIASAMEFLASKKVVHADLATRNILLAHDKTAKISDFGLSRRLSGFGNYVKKGHEPLPWRWMAPEALRKREFNEKTDVWSFGVTLWEIYSLGELPYRGIDGGLNFWTQLTKGVRLEEPAYNSDEMYTKMLRCWNLDPASRPSFVKLKEMLEQCREN